MCGHDHVHPTNKSVHLHACYALVLTSHLSLNLLHISACLRMETPVSPHVAASREAVLRRRA